MTKKVKFMSQYDMQPSSDISMIILHLLTSTDVITAVLFKSFSSSWNLHTGIAGAWILCAFLYFRVFR